MERRLVLLGLCIGLGAAAWARIGMVRAAEAQVRESAPPPIQDMLAPPATDRDTREAARALWTRFTGHLRAGRMREAYACFAPASREVLSFDEFCGQFHPLSAVCEAVLAPAVNTRWRFQGDKAVLWHLAAPAAPDGPAPEVELPMVREGGSWRLVTLSRWPRASMEADARRLLRAMHGHLAGLAEAAGTPARTQDLARAFPELRDAALFRAVASVYRIEIREAAEGLEARAVPRDADRGLRGFVLGRDGAVRTVAARDETRARAMAEIEEAAHAER